MNIFNHLDPLTKSLWFVAIPATTIIMIRLLLILFGKDGTENVAIHTNNKYLNGHRWFTFRNVVNFLFACSWSGIALRGYIPNTALLLLITTITGLLFAAAINRLHPQ